MRPLRLEVQGLASYRQKIEVAFSELDLFAIWGPTGAGKSSLVDAITFALYGQVPRVGKTVKELISQGEERMRVSLEFSANGGRYRIFRETAKRGGKPPQLERFHPATDEWLPEDVDRVKDTNAYVENLLRMDYQAFIRSVLLPQGEFQEFLSGDRDERRKVIDGLLRLGVYALMHQKANQAGGAAEADANRLRERLAAEFADATPEAMKAAGDKLATLDELSAQLASEREKLEAASHTAGTLSDALGRAKQAKAAVVPLQKSLADARALLTSGEKDLAEIDAKVTALDTQAKAIPYDADLHVRLTNELNLAQQLEQAEERVKKLIDGLTREQSSLKKLEAVSTTGAKALEAARKAAAQAQEDFDRARRENLAEALRQGLKPGDPCPVCGQKVASLPAAEHAELDAAKRALNEAQAAEKKASDEANASQTGLAVAMKSLQTADQQLSEATAGVAASTKKLDSILTGQRISAKEVAEQVRQQVDGKKAMDKLRGEAASLKAQRDARATAIASAGTEVTRLDAEAMGLEKQMKEANDAAANAAKELLAAARKGKWDDIVAAVEAARAVEPRLSERLDAARRQEANAQQEIGATRTRIEQIEKDIERVAGLREEEASRRAEATLAKDLGSLLRTDRFPTFIREQALRTLADDGSRRLNEISSGRYDFEVEGQDFVIIDRWNGSERRSVKTLSGGETFLASLALALALAEQLPGLSGNGGEGALESLFIDEGFSHLDNETLDTVASALEVLGQDRKRLVGVITHLPALAERMPARITVHKSQSGSTITVD